MLQAHPSITLDLLASILRIEIEYGFPATICVKCGHYTLHKRDFITPGICTECREIATHTPTSLVYNKQYRVPITLTSNQLAKRRESRRDLGLFCPCCKDWKSLDDYVLPFDVEARKKRISCCGKARELTEREILIHYVSAVQ